jgi:hypothetical protein
MPVQQGLRTADGGLRNLRVRFYGLQKQRADDPSDTRTLQITGNIQLGIQRKNIHLDAGLSSGVFNNPSFVPLSVSGG